MPNICENELYITGPIKHIKRFKKKAKWKLKEEEIDRIRNQWQEVEGDFKCSNIVPYPNDDTNLIEFYGTKWDCTGELINEELDARHEEGELLYQIDSAWAPPLEWMRKASNIFKKLKFTMNYVEFGMAFCGEAFAEKGELQDIPGDFEQEHPPEDEDCIS